MNSSVSQSNPIPAVSTTVAVASTVPSGLPSPWALGPSSVPQFSFHGDTVSKDPQEHFDFIPEQHEAATCPSISRLSDLRNVRVDLAVVTATRSVRNSTMAHLCTENSQLLGKVSPLTSEIGSFQEIRDELDLSQPVSGQS